MHAGTNDTELSGQHLVVRSGCQVCAIPVASAKLVTAAPELTLLPGSAPRLLGLAQVSGEAVAVVDLHALLDPDGAPGDGHELTVIVRRSDGVTALGLAVDEAFGVTKVEASGAAESEDPDWIVGRGRMDGRDVVLLDPERLFET